MEGYAALYAGIRDGESYVVARATSIDDVLFPTYGTYELEVLINDVRKNAVRFYIDALDHRPRHGEPRRTRRRQPTACDTPQGEPALEEGQRTF